MRCPLCEDQLRPLERNGVEIEMCPTCKGVWLDRGKLDTLLAGAGSMEGHPHVDDQQRTDDHSKNSYDRSKHSDDRGRYTDERAKPAEGKRKSGGLLGGLFDTIGGGGGD
jgi:Zn-finger nucleic acid-binding protein